MRVLFCQNNPVKSNSVRTIPETQPAAIPPQKKENLAWLVTITGKDHYTELIQLSNQISQHESYNTLRDFLETREDLSPEQREKIRNYKFPSTQQSQPAGTQISLLAEKHNISSDAITKIVTCPDGSIDPEKLDHFRTSLENIAKNQNAQKTLNILINGAGEETVLKELDSIPAGLTLTDIEDALKNNKTILQALIKKPDISFNSTAKKALEVMLGKYIAKFFVDYKGKIPTSEYDELLNEFISGRTGNAKLDDYIIRMIRYLPTKEAQEDFSLAFGLDIILDVTKYLDSGETSKALGALAKFREFQKVITKLGFEHIAKELDKHIEEPIKRLNAILAQERGNGSTMVTQVTPEQLLDFVNAKMEEIAKKIKESQTESQANKIKNEKLAEARNFLDSVKKLIEKIIHNNLLARFAGLPAWLASIRTMLMKLIQIV